MNVQLYVFIETVILIGFGISGNIKLILFSFNILIRARYFTGISVQLTEIF